MESNREEAKRCLQLAVEAYRNHSSEADNLSLEKAKRLTRKSIRLYPSEEAEGNYDKHFLNILVHHFFNYFKLFWTISTNIVSVYIIYRASSDS